MRRRFRTLRIGSIGISGGCGALIDGHSGLLESDRKNYTGYHKQLAQDARTPENNEFDLIRTQFEAALFPNFFQDVRFGSLSLDGRGLSSYGAYTMVLKEDLIAHRASVFEENPYIFCKKHKILMTESIPSGYRAVWSERNILAMAKLHPEISPATKDSEFSAILAKERQGADETDFIEVHIYGPINRNTIERVVGRKPRSGEDKVIWKRLERLLNAVGAKLEEI